MDVDKIIEQLEIAQAGIVVALGAFREIKRNMAPPDPPIIKPETSVQRRLRMGEAVRKREAAMAKR